MLCFNCFFSNYPSWDPQCSRSAMLSRYRNMLWDMFMWLTDVWGLNSKHFEIKCFEFKPQYNCKVNLSQTSERLVLEGLNSQGCLPASFAIVISPRHQTLEHRGKKEEGAKNELCTALVGNTSGCLCVPLSEWNTKRVANTELKDSWPSWIITDAIQHFVFWAITAATRMAGQGDSEVGWAGTVNQTEMVSSSVKLLSKECLSCKHPNIHITWLDMYFLSVA